MRSEDERGGEPAEGCSLIISCEAGDQGQRAVALAVALAEWQQVFVDLEIRCADGAGEQACGVPGAARGRI